MVTLLALPFSLLHRDPSRDRVPDHLDSLYLYRSLAQRHPLLLSEVTESLSNYKVS